MIKKILIVDDSALMRRVFCDIIKEDNSFLVEDMAVNGAEALLLIKKKSYDAVVLDVNMPVMTGIELLYELKRLSIRVRILMASTDTKEGAKVTLDALALGATDFIHIPVNTSEVTTEVFRDNFLELLRTVSESNLPAEEKLSQTVDRSAGIILKLTRKHRENFVGRKIVAIASSTGGPKALQEIIPKLPADIGAPILVVQHMPFGFTKSLAERLDSISTVCVKEAEEGESLNNGVVYIAQGGLHMNVVMKNGINVIHYTDDPPREGVRPCANYMYESIADTNFNEVVCVVLTGMGADGSKGIKTLSKHKKVHVIAQSKETCAVFGMPASVIREEVVDQIIPIYEIPREILLKVGVSQITKDTE